MSNVRLTRLLSIPPTAMVVGYLWTVAGFMLRPTSRVSAARLVMHRYRVSSTTFWGEDVVALVEHLASAKVHKAQAACSSIVERARQPKNKER